MRIREDHHEKILLRDSDDKGGIGLVVCDYDNGDEQNDPDGNVIT